MPISSRYETGRIDINRSVFTKISRRNVCVGTALNKFLIVLGCKKVIRILLKKVITFSRIKLGGIECL